MAPTTISEQRLVVTKLEGTFMKHLLIISAAILTTAPALSADRVRIASGIVCIDCTTKNPSHMVPSINDHLHSIMDAQNERLSASASVREAEAAQKQEQAHKARVDEATIRANNSIAAANAAEANRSNAAAAYLDRSNRPRPFQSGY